MTGKEKCNLLKELRSDIAKANDIEWHESECHHEGNCLGTCPKCESEVQRLENEINIKKGFNQAIKLAGVGILLAGSAFGCQKLDEPLDGDIQVIEPLDGDVEYDGDIEEIDNNDIEIEELAGDVPDVVQVED